MTEKQIRAALQECARFETAARTALATRDRVDALGEPCNRMSTGKTTAAARRASMDLSRALSEMRGRS